MSSTRASKAVEEESTDVEPRLYEIAVLYPYPIGEREHQQLLKEVEAIFAEAGAKVIAKDLWGRRGLAYSIKGSMEGNFAIYHVEMDPLRLKDINQAMKIEKNVLRHMVIKPPKNYKIVKYSELYEQWLKDREKEKEQDVRQSEDKVREQVARRAKQQRARATERQKETESKPQAIQEDQLTEQLEKLIKDDISL